jgi:VWFA-related protein
MNPIRGNGFAPLKKAIHIVAAMTLCLALFAQEPSHDVSVINIEVPVRVFKGSTFVDNLTINDFEVYEDGKLQKIEAVYLIKKTNIESEETLLEKKEARKKFAPEVSRNFVLLFEITDYLPKLKEALEYFFENVITPGDTLMVVTPVKSYKFNKKALEIASRLEIAKNLNEKLRADITTGSRDFKKLIREVEDILSPDYPIPMELKLSMLKDKIREIKNLRYLDEKKLQDFADLLKNMNGQKYVFLFYQKVLIPYPDLPLDSFEYLELTSELTSLNLLDVEKIKHVYSDSSISIHFLYITNTGERDPNIDRIRPTGLELQDISMDIFSTFREISLATGGTVDSSANAAASFEKVVNASENYYLLYYAPKNYKADGKFREIKVKVKNKDYQITHRAGYLAD